MHNTKYAPIILFVYNRLDYLSETIDALKANYLAPETNLIIYADGAKAPADMTDVNAVNDYISKISGFKSLKIVNRERNYGLSENIMLGVEQVLKEHRRAIILEDDLITHPSFLSFMNDALEKYKNNQKVISIHGFTLPAKNLPKNYFLRGADCWGWATWDDRWELMQKDATTLYQQLKTQGLSRYFDLDGRYLYTRMLRLQMHNKINSWAIRWHASAFLARKLTLYPGKSLVTHIGYQKGVHHKQTSNSLINGILSDEDIHVISDIEVTESKIARQSCKNFYDQLSKTYPLLKRLAHTINKRVSIL